MADRAPLITETDPKYAADHAGLNHVSDRRPGIRRTGRPKRFVYRDPSGRIIRDPKMLQRFRSLVIPPAWTDVWISPDIHGHLQATGRDARGRKQYRYHPRWRETRDSTKYHRMVLFGKILPKIRAQVRRDLNIRELRRVKVLATIVRLLETTSMRVGNEEYAKQNRTFGLTTLQDRHVRVHGEHLQFFFRGKSGVRHRISVDDRALAKVVRKLQDLPGYELFQFVDGEGNTHSIDSMDVNTYIREISGEEFTAKDFRTWNGTVLAATTLGKMQPCSSQQELKKNVLAAIAAVAEHLGNTVAICRKCYIHPEILDAYMTQELASAMSLGGRRRGLSAHETAVLRFLCQAPGSRKIS